MSDSKTEQVVVVYIDPAEKFLMRHRADRNHPDYLDEWFFPGEEVPNLPGDSRDDAWMDERLVAVARIFKEQTGFEVKPHYKEIAPMRSVYALPHDRQTRTRIWTIPGKRYIDEMLREHEMPTGWTLQGFDLSNQYLMSAIHSEGISCSLTAHTVMLLAHRLGYQHIQLKKW